MKKEIKYGLLTVGWIISGVVLLIVLVLLLVQTRPAKRYMARQAGILISKNIHGTLSIGKIEGNFFSNLSVENTILTLNDDTLASIDAIHARYNLRPLLQNTMVVHSFEIINPRFFLRQENDSLWNIQQIIPSATEKPDQEKESPGNFHVRLPLFRIENGFIRIAAFDTLIPQSIENLNTELSIFWTKEEKQANLQQFSLSTRQPDFHLKRLEFSLLQNNQFIELQNFKIETALNTLAGELSYTPEQRAGNAHLEIPGLSLREFSSFIPNLKFPATPRISLNAGMDENTVWGTLEIEEQNQKIAFQVASENLADVLFQSSDSVLNYSLTGEFDQVDLARWLGKEEIPYTLDGTIKATGRGFNPATAQVAVSGRFNNWVLPNRQTGNLHFDVNLDHGNLAGIMEGNGKFGSFSLDPSVKNLTGVPSYRANLSTQNLDLKSLTGIEELNSSLNITGHISGTEFDPEKMTASVLLNILNSRFQHITIDTLITAAHYRKSNLILDSLWAKTRTTQLTASGNYSFKSRSDLQLSAAFSGLEEFHAYLPDTSMKTSGFFQAGMGGSPGAYTLNTTVELDTTRYGETSLAQVRLKATGQLTTKDTVLQARLKAEKIKSGNLLIDSVDARIEGSADSLVLNTGFSLNKAACRGMQINHISGKLDYAADRVTTETAIKIDSTGNVNILAAVPLQISADSMKININKKEPVSGRVIISGISLDLLEEMGITELVGGIFEGEVKLSGTVESPAVDGKFALQDATFSDYRFINCDGAMHYSDNLLSLNALVVPQDSGRLEAIAEIPLHLSPDSLKFSMSDRDSIQGKLTINKLTLALLQAMYPAGKITGNIDGEIILAGTIESPAPGGYIELQDASVFMREYGIDYREAGLRINLQRKKIGMENLLVRSRDGTLSGSGRIDFSKDLFGGDISQSEVTLNFNRFQPFNHRQFNMEINGTATLGGKKGEVIYGGKLTIPRSEIYIPAVMRMLGRMTVPEIPEPLLVQEMEKMSEQEDTIHLKPMASTTANDSLPGYLDDFKGNLRLHIPRNTWIKNKDMYLEISGDLELRKNRKYFELFGSVDIVRGQYDFLGKTFKINEGSVSFRGGETMMPYLNIKALYTFRNQQRVEQQLSLHISGSAESPQVQFNLDGNSVSEGDALSYILFGKSMNELTIGEQDNMTGQEDGSLAEMAAASILSAQITSFLSDKLAVDYLEVKSDKGFDNATVVVGKYITNDLFVSYEQRFGETREKNMAKYEVKLEYELFPFLFFELNNSSRESGFDVIFKFDTK